MLLDELILSNLKRQDIGVSTSIRRFNSDASSQEVVIEEPYTLDWSITNYSSMINLISVFKLI